VTSPTLPRVDVLGVHVNVLDLPTAVDVVDDWIREVDQHYVCVTGVHGVMECQRDEELREVHNHSGLTTPDGMPMVWAGRRAGIPGGTRVYGPDLMLAVLQRAAQRGWRSYFYGGGAGVADRLAARLRERIPGLQVVGTWTPPFRPLTQEEDDAVVADINARRPDIVWVGLSTPKQERWMAQHEGRLHAPVLIGVGAAFDLHAGLLRQAPRWMQDAGLEWAFRLGVEPRRLWRRYLTNNPRFVLRILRRPPRPVVPTDGGGRDEPAATGGVS
jgi:N-acetylglucosaminyldiphosphoundecaprenol N-acetyl-beta-D-mannosaminyltransferase